MLFKNLILAAISIPILIGCIPSSHAFDSIELPTDTEVSQFHADNAESIIIDYSSCITSNWRRESRRRLTEGGVPSYVAKHIEKLCLDEEHEMYLAFFSTAFANQDVENKYRHLTAQKGVRRMKNYIFGVLAAESQHAE